MAGDPAQHCSFLGFAIAIAFGLGQSASFEGSGSRAPFEN